RRAFGVARQNAHALRFDVELLGRDLGQGGEHPLPELDLAGRKPHGPVRLEADPAIEPRVVGEAVRQRAHAAAPLFTDAGRCAARMTRLCAPQRHRFLSSAAAISARLGAGLRSSSALAQTRIPLRQKPHWPACSARNACCRRAKVPDWAKPSTVVTCLPVSVETRRVHAKTGSPAASTMQAPHYPSPQPKRVARTPSSLRSTSSRFACSPALTRTGRPFTVRSKVLGICECAAIRECISPAARIDNDRGEVRRCLLQSR